MSQGTSVLLYAARSKKTQLLLKTDKGRIHFETAGACKQAWHPDTWSGRSHDQADIEFVTLLYHLSGVTTSERKESHG